MKLIIDIDEEEYEATKNEVEENGLVFKPYTLIANGTPFDSVINDIKAGIEKAIWEDIIVSLDGTDEISIPRLEPDDVFEIIDKYKAESEDP